jgi:hypothetical protein
MWQSVGKIIDRLHLKNHKDPLCNTMAAEQVNVWASRLKRIMVALPYIHHMLFFHRMVKRRNSYTELCYKVGKQPIVPRAAKKWFKNV